MASCIHLIEGKSGCRYAREHKCAAVIVDALRASATAAMMLDAGAREIFMVSEVDDAFSLKKRIPKSLLYGERNGLPPDGFDGGNSPRTLQNVRDRTVIFTTTTGAQHMVSAWGATRVMMATTLNVTAAADAIKNLRGEVVIIPAGLSTDPTFPAQEDWTAAVAIARACDTVIDTGAEAYRFLIHRIETEGIEHLFLTSAHAEKLRRIGLEEDVVFCAQQDLTTSIPVAVEQYDGAVRCVDLTHVNGIADRWA